MTLLPARKSLTPTGDPNTYYNKGETDALLSGKASTDLTNLSSTGQMIIDSQNGTISNCVLDIPQLLKLKLSDNVITHKAGSIQTQCGDIYATYTLTQDRSTTISNSLADGLYFVNPSNNGTLTITAQEKFGSGSSLPADGAIYERFFLTTDKKMYHYGAGTWSSSGLNYPVCMIKMTSGVASFAKDSNGNDMIFNGAGFIGHHAFVYPNVKRLRANGFNADGTLSSVLHTTASLQIIEMSSNRNCILLDGVAGYYQEIDDLSQAINSSWWLWYVKNLNLAGGYNNNTFTGRTYTPLVSFTLDNNNQVTNWTPRIPVRLATTEMLDKVQSQVDTNTTAISGKQDTLVSGTNIKTINSTSVLGSGNFTLADQSLSNLDSTGQMVVDSQNGTISNCILEIPQNLKLTLENNVLTLASGSVVALTGYNTYTTRTTTANITKDSWASGWYNKTVLLYIGSTGTWFGFKEVSKVGSGSSLPVDNTNFDDFYLTTDYSLYEWENGTWSKKNFSYPLAIVNVDSNGVASFAKDSNGNDMIFNGAGFVGDAIFTYPNIKGLIPNGFNEDGSLRSIEFITNSLTIITSLGSYNSHRFVVTNGGSWSVTPILNYNKEVNRNSTGSGYWNFISAIEFDLNVNASPKITDFTIRQPYQGARSLLTDDVDEQVKQNTTDISTKQNDLTTVSGYDATATQVLKNINGVLTWVTEE